MDWLSLSGNVASILGLAVALYTLYKVSMLPAALKQHSRDRQLTELIDKITRLPATKQTIPNSTAREVEFLLVTIRTYYVSSLPFRHRTLKATLQALEQELQGAKNRIVVQNQLKLIRDEILIR